MAEEDITITTESLLDTLHRCLKCEAPAYHDGAGLYICSDPKCKFSWKVEDYGDE